MAVLAVVLLTLVVCGTAGAAEERLLVTDPVDGAEADLREVRITRTASGGATIVVRLQLETAPDGPRVDLVLGASPSPTAAAACRGPAAT